MLVTWDEPKRLANLEARSLDFAMISESFFAAAVVVDGKNDRHIALGRIDDVPYAVVFEPLGSEAITIISLRVASKKERALI